MPVLANSTEQWSPRNELSLFPLFPRLFAMTHLKRPWCWEGLGAGEEGDDGGWDGWMASPTRWTWVWVNSGSWWWTGRPGMLWFMGSQRVGHNWRDLAAAAAVYRSNTNVCTAVRQYRRSWNSKRMYPFFHPLLLSRGHQGLKKVHRWPSYKEIVSYILAYIYFYTNGTFFYTLYIPT